MRAVDFSHRIGRAALAYVNLVFASWLVPGLNILSALRFPLLTSSCNLYVVSFNYIQWTEIIMLPQHLCIRQTRRPGIGLVWRFFGKLETVYKPVDILGERTPKATALSVEQRRASTVCTALPATPHPRICEWKSSCPIKTSFGKLDYYLRRSSW